MRNGLQAGAWILFRCSHYELCYTGGASVLFFSGISGADRDTAMVLLWHIHAVADRADAVYIQDITPALDQHAGHQAQVRIIC